MVTLLDWKINANARLAKHVNAIVEVLIVTEMYDGLSALP